MRPAYAERRASFPLLHSVRASSDGAPRASQSRNASASCARRHSSKIESAIARTPPSLPPAARHCSCSHASNSSASGSAARSEEHTSELQSPCNLVCRLLLEKKKKYFCKSSARLVDMTLASAHYIISQICTCSS